MKIEIIEKLLDILNFQMKKERKIAILFLDNVTVHPASLTDTYNNIKIVFLPKNTASSLHPLDAGMIQTFKTKYRKKLMLYVMKRINDDLFASEIAKDIGIFQAIKLVADAWKEGSVETIKNCFAKCCITEHTSEDENDIVD